MSDINSQNLANLSDPNLAYLSGNGSAAPLKEANQGSIAMGAADAGTFGAAKYLAHLLGSNAFENAQNTDPFAYQGGKTLGDIGSSFIPGVGLAGKGIKALGSVAKGADWLKGLGTGIENLGSSGRLAGMAGRGALESGLNTEAHNVGNDINGESNQDTSILGSMLLGGGLGAAGSALGNLGHISGDAVHDAELAALGVLGLGKRDIQGLAKNPGSNASAQARLQTQMDEAHNLAQYANENDFYKMNPTEALDKAHSRVKDLYGQIDDVVSQNKDKLSELFDQNWKNEAGELKNDYQGITNPDGGAQVLDIHKGLINYDPLEQSDIGTKVKSLIANGNLYEARSYIQNQMKNMANRYYAGGSNPVYGLPMDAWRGAGRALDDAVDNVVGDAAPSLKDLGKQWRYNETIADGLIKKESGMGIGGNSDTFIRGQAADLASGKGNPLSAMAGQLFGSTVGNATRDIFGYGANAMRPGLEAFSNAINKPVFGGQSSADLLHALSIPGSRFAARLAPQLLNQQYQPSPQSSGNSPFESPGGPLAPVGQTNPYQGMQGPVTNVSTGHHAVDMANMADEATRGNPDAQGAFHQAIMTGLQNQWNSNPYYRLFMGDASMDNPQFQKYIQGALWTMTNHGTTNIQPDKAGQYLFLDPKDQEMYGRGIQALRTVTQNLPTAMRSTGLGGMVNNATGGTFDAPADQARYAIARGMANLIDSQGGGDPFGMAKEQVNRILNNPLISAQERTHLIYDLLRTSSPQTYNLMLQSGINPESL